MTTAVLLTAAAVRELLPAWEALVPRDPTLRYAIETAERGGTPEQLERAYRSADISVVVAEDAGARVSELQLAAIDAATAVRRLVQGAACPDDPRFLRWALEHVAEHIGWPRVAASVAEHVGGQVDVEVLSVLLEEATPVELAVQAAVALAA